MVRATVENWNARTPDDFVFSVKVPQMITHDKVLVDCDAEIAEFLETMDILGGKLGPIIFQFPFFSRSIFLDRHAFTDRLIPFLKKLPANHKFGIEIRNRWHHKTARIPDRGTGAHQGAQDCYRR